MYQFSTQNPSETEGPLKSHKETNEGADLISPLLLVEIVAKARGARVGSFNKINHTEHPQDHPQESPTRTSDAENTHGSSPRGLYLALEQ